MNVLLWALLFIIYLHPLECRQHTLDIQSDDRRYLPLTTFGFMPGGVLDIRVLAFYVDPAALNGVFGFTLDRTMSDAMNPYLDGHMTRCTLTSGITNLDTKSAIIYFTFDFKRQIVRVNCSDSVSGLQILPLAMDQKDRVRTRRAIAPSSLTRPQSSVAPDALIRPNPSIAPYAFTQPVFSRSSKLPQTLAETDAKYGGAAADLTGFSALTGPQRCSRFASIPLLKDSVDGRDSYSTAFRIKMEEPSSQGLYSLFFHNCANYGRRLVPVNMTVSMVESNRDSFLSAGEVPLPALYFIMAIIFFSSSIFWVVVLRKSDHLNVYRTHYVMAMLGFMKAMSLMFHGINYHVIGVNGYHIEAWAVLFYITHLMKGALLFITILLLGTGWTFIKHVLSDREKKMFMTVIPLQLLANVAQIILEESEEGDIEHTTWREILYLMDITCCGAILFPVVWSIRHLQEASKTDGKAVMNLKKLQLFRHFYVMIVCYIYFTRIVVYLLQIMVPFQYEWLDEMFRELATFLFFAVTAFKFQPADNNPYFQVPLSDDELEMDEVLTETGLTEGLSRVRNRTDPVGDRKGDSATHEETQRLTQRESSHDLD